MAWIGKREQVLVGLLFVLLLAVATAGRLAAASDGHVWLASPPVGTVSVADASVVEGPPQPTLDQVQAALQKRIGGLESAVLQSELDLTVHKQQILTLRGQVSEGAAKLHATEQDLESTREQLLSEQAMRENLTRMLAKAEQRSQALAEELQQAKAQVTLLQSQVIKSVSGAPPVVQAAPTSAGRP